MDGVTSVGRGKSADVKLCESSSWISRDHFKLSPHTFTITDMSRNGTWLDGTRLTKGVAVALGDAAVIGLAAVDPSGGTLQLRFTRELADDGPSATVGSQAARSESSVRPVYSSPPRPMLLLVAFTACLGVKVALPFGCTSP